MNTTTRYRIRVYAQDNPWNPREENENIGTMACWHRRYTLGDEQPDVSPAAHTYALARDVDDTLPEWDDATDADAQRAQEVFDAQYLHLPLYLYDHSGITMQTTPFSCPWDSGQVGFIYVSRKRAAEEWGEDFIDVRVLAGLVAEVEEYDQYLTGEVYGFEIEEAETFEKTSHKTGWTEEVDEWRDYGRCGEFYGSDPEKNGMLGNVEAFAHDALKSAAHDIGEWVEFEVTPHPNKES